VTLSDKSNIERPLIKNTPTRLRIFGFEQREGACGGLGDGLGYAKPLWVSYNRWHAPWTWVSFTLWHALAY